jgi:serine/threonine-protein kinase
VPVAEALPIARQIAEAVEAAHERGVMHRDLKPANVKVTDDGRVKVLDFGLARALEGDAPAASSTDSPTMSPTLSPTLQSPVTGALTGANVILGTAAYMSPEQARGKAVDKRCDIWAFGVILFEMLTGRSLFAGETVSDTLAGVLKTEPDWDSLPPETPPRIVRLLRRCLERDPRKRLRDMGDARILITEVMEGRHEEAAPAAAGPVAAPRPARPWLAAVLLVAGLAGGAAIGWTLRPAPPEPEVRRFLIPIPEGNLEDAVISPDGRHLAYVLDDELWIRAMDRIEPRRVEGSQGADSPTWSPDGSMIAFHAGEKLWRTGLADTKPTLIGELEGVASPRWQEDGTIVFVTDRALRRVSSRGGEVETLRELAADEAEDLHGVEILPGGRGWIVIVHDVPDKDTIALEAWTAQERKRILELPYEDASLWGPG